jgi:hypothetical protein
MIKLPIRLPIRLPSLMITTGILLGSVPAIASEPVYLQANIDVPIDDGLLCYMVKSDGTVLNLNNICGRNVNPTDRDANAQIYSPPPGNLGGLEIFGRGNNFPPCYGLDDQGRRCPTAQPQ